MQVNSNSLYDFSSNYTIKLNERETLVVEDDPLQKERVDAQKAAKEQESQEKKTEEAKKSSDPDALSEDEKRVVKELASRDSEVKAHEAAHQAAGGGMTGAASYTYQQGPDGKMYAIGGEVSISTPPASTPEEAIRNARQVAAAAMAAGNPSPQDFAVAASAKMMEVQAEQQKTQELQEKLGGQETYANQALSTDTSQKKRSSLDISA